METKGPLELPGDIPKLHLIRTRILCRNFLNSINLYAFIPALPVTSLT